MAKKVVSKKTEAVKAAVESKTEAAAETIAAKPETEKVAAPQKSVSEPETVSVSEPEAAPVKKDPAKKSASKKEAAADKEAAAPSMPHPEVFVQYYGKEASVREIISNIRKAWTEETGKDASEMKDLKIYIKPEENVAYYVIDEQTRSISL